MLIQLQASYSIAPTCLPRGHYFLLLEFLYHSPELYLAFLYDKQDAASTEHPGDAVLLLQGRPDSYGIYVLPRRPGRYYV